MREAASAALKRSVSSGEGQAAVRHIHMTDFEHAMELVPASSQRSHSLITTLTPSALRSTASASSAADSEEGSSSGGGDKPWDARAVWTTIGGMERTKRTLTQLITFPLMHPLTCRRLGLQRTGGVLLYGPPGMSSPPITFLPLLRCTSPLFTLIVICDVWRWGVMWRLFENHAIAHAVYGHSAHRFVLRIRRSERLQLLRGRGRAHSARVVCAGATQPPVCGVSRRNRRDCEQATVGTAVCLFFSSLVVFKRLIACYHLTLCVVASLVVIPVGLAVLRRVCCRLCSMRWTEWAIAAVERAAHSVAHAPSPNSSARALRPTTKTTPKRRKRQSTMRKSRRSRRRQKMMRVVMQALSLP